MEGTGVSIRVSFQEPIFGGISRQLPVLSAMTASEPEVVLGTSTSQLSCTQVGIHSPDCP